MTRDIIVNNPRLPNSPAVIMDEFETLICNLEAQEMEYQIVGDLNCDLLEMGEKLIVNVLLISWIFIN